MVMDRLGVAAEVAVPVGVLATLALRLAAVRFNLTLPLPR